MVFIEALIFFLNSTRHKHSNYYIEKQLRDKHIETDNTCKHAVMHFLVEHVPYCVDGYRTDAVITNTIFYIIFHQ